KDYQTTTGVRTVLAAPLLRNGAALGSILIRRSQVRPFTARQIALLKTFADQAAIAIENARLSQELQDRNQTLTEALDREKATSEILRIISSSPTDLQPVLDAMAKSAARLCDSRDVGIFRLEGDGLRLVARYGSIPTRAGLVLAADRSTVGGRSVVERQIVQ